MHWLPVDKQDINFLKNVALFREIQSKNQFRESTGQIPLSNQKIKELKSTLNISSYIETYGRNITFEVVERVESDYGLRCRFWREKRITANKKSVELIREGENIEGDEINLFAKSFDPFNNPDFTEFSLILNLEEFLKKKHYSPRTETPRRKKMTLFQCLVSAKHPSLWGSKFDQKVDEYTEKWGLAYFSIKDYRKLYSLFNIGLEIWDLRRENGRKIYTKMFDCKWKDKIVVEIEKFDDKNPKWLLNKPITLVPSRANLNLHLCPTESCFFGTDRYDRWQKHMLDCKSETVVEYKQVRREKTDFKTRRELYEAGFLPSMDWENRAFVVWDVECLMEKGQDLRDESISAHRLATIGLAMSLNPEENLKTVFLHRKSMKPEDLKRLVEAFWKTLESFRIEMLNSLPKKIQIGVAALRKHMKGAEFRAKSPMEKSRVCRQLNYLQRLTCLKVMSWNGEKYDHNIVFSPLMSYFKKDKKSFQNLSCIKRGTGYMQIQYQGICLRDMMNFTPPMSLGEFFDDDNKYLFFTINNYK